MLDLPGSDVRSDGLGKAGKVFLDKNADIGDPQIVRKEGKLSSQQNPSGAKNNWAS